MMRRIFWLPLSIRALDKAVGSGWVPTHVLVTNRSRRTDEKATNQS